MYSLKGKLIPLLLFFFVASCCPTISDASATIENDSKDVFQKWVSNAREQYDKLPDQGKFATGAAVGFTTSKLTVNSAVKFVKIFGATYVATEVLEAAGILEIETYTDSESSQNIKRMMISKIGDFRTSVRKRFGQKTLKRWLESDKMGTLGAATGAFFGFLL